MPPLLLDDEPETATGDEFALDLTVITIAGPIPISLCDTSDGCGETCSGSACSSHSNDPTLV